jgi:DNA-binding MarR family transcriptional regulator
MPPEMKWSHEMARTKTAPDTAHTAAHAAPDPAPAPATAPAADSHAAAVCAALAANPGSTVAAIADAAGTGKPAARTALLEMEKDGTATRIKGAKPGIPDTWTLADPAPDTAAPAADPEADPAVQPGEDPAGSPDGAAEDETVGGTGQDGAVEVGDPAPEDGDNAEAAAPGPETAEPEPEPHDAPAEDVHEDAAPDEPDGEAAPGSAPDDGDAPDDEDAPADAGGGAGDEPDPGLATELIESLDQIRAAADAAEMVLTASRDLKTVLAGLDEIAEQAAQARRSLKAAIGGRKAPAARPGALRDKVLAHLVEHPGKEFTPHEIHKVLDHSSGAIANALDTLVKHGEAEVATEKPRKFRRAAQPAEAAPGADNADNTDDPDGAGADDAELAGAA